MKAKTIAYLQGLGSILDISPDDVDHVDIPGSKPVKMPRISGKRFTPEPLYFTPRKNLSFAHRARVIRFHKGEILIIESGHPNKSK